MLVILRLRARGPMTIADLARSVDHTHSGMSQKVAARLAAEWRATEASLAEIEAEIPYPMSRIAQDVRAVLARKSFHDRIAETLAADPVWTDS